MSKFIYSVQWFEEWFDSPYYHLLYENRSEDEAAAFIGRLADKLQIPKGAKVLDAACGKGRHARILEQLGYDVTGIDLSKNSIHYAKGFANENLRFLIHDMREVYQDNKFDYVFNLFSSFGYCESDEEDLRTMKAFAGDLKRPGTLVLDYINTEWAVKNMKPRDIVARGDIQFHVQKKLENGFIKKKIEFLADGENYSFEEQLKLINLFKFETMMRESGLQLKQLFGDYELNAFVPGTSPRLIMIAQKE